MNVLSPFSHWEKSWGVDYGDLYIHNQMQHDADFSVSPLEIGPSSNLQGYGELLTIIGATAAILSAVGGGVATGITLAQQAKARRKAREAAKKEKQTAKLLALQAATARRSQESDAAIATSRSKIAAVRQEAEAQRGGAIILPAVLAVGILTLIAYKASK